MALRVTGLYGNFSRSQVESALAVFAEELSSTMAQQFVDGRGHETHAVPAFPKGWRVFRGNECTSGHACRVRGHPVRDDDVLEADRLTDIVVLCGSSALVLTSQERVHNVG